MKVWSKDTVLKTIVYLKVQQLEVEATIPNGSESNIFPGKSLTCFQKFVMYDIQKPPLEVFL